MRGEKGNYLSSFNFINKVWALLQRLRIIFLLLFLCPYYVIASYFSVSECFTNELGNVNLTVGSPLPAVLLQEYCMQKGEISDE